MADNDQKLVVMIEFDDGSVKKGFVNIESQAAESAKNINKEVGAADKGLGGLGKTATIAAAAFAVFKTVKGTMGFFADAIREASNNADEINKINSALVSTGKYSQETSQQLQGFADSLEKVTAFSGGAVLESAALIQQLGRLSSGELQRATKASLDLATALGIDATSASMLLGKAANGNVEAFKRYGIEIRKGANDTETFANALATLEARFGGSSERAAATFSGSLAILGNQYNKLLETIGQYITQSPALIAVFRVVGEWLGKLSEYIQSTFGNKDILRPFISGLITAAAVITSVFGPALEIVWNMSNALRLSFLTGISLISEAFYGLGGIISKVLNSIGLSNSFTQFFDEAYAKNKQLTDSLANETANAFANVGSTARTSGLLEYMAQLQGAVDQTNGSLASLDTGLKNSANSVKESSDELKAWADVIKSIAQQIQQGLGQAASKGIQMFVTNLQKGKNALSGFGKFILAAMGDLAIQVGQVLLTTGIGMLALKGLDASGAIAAGAGLIALGTIMKNIGGGEDSGINTTQGGVANETPGVYGPTSDLQDVEQKPQTTISLNIQGDVLDSRDTGLRIVDLIKEYTDRNGNTVLA